MLSRLGELFSRLGELLSRLGELLSRLGELLSRLGELFSRLGELLISPRRVTITSPAAAGRDPVMAIVVGIRVVDSSL